MDDPVGLTPQERERTHVVELEDIPESWSNLGKLWALLYSK